MKRILQKLFGSNKEIAKNAANASLKEKEHSKIQFSFYSNILEEWTIETMWAEAVDENKGLYKLDNIPFYVSEIASGDIVFAEYDETEERLTYRKTVEYSGNSTIHVVVMNEEYDKDVIRGVFKKSGCPSEGLNRGYFAMEVPADINYKPIKEKLDELRSKGIIDYAESCLSEQHQY